MTLIKKTIAGLGCIGVLTSLAACGGSSEDTITPSTSAPVASPASPDESPEMMTSGPTPESKSPEAPESPSSEPTESEDAPIAGEIPASIQGRWVGTEGGDIQEQCTQPDEGNILEIDATTLNFFAAISTLESVEESGDNSILGKFTTQDDSDMDVTETIKLQLQDDGETLEFAILDSDVDPAPAIYGRCS